MANSVPYDTITAIVNLVKSAEVLAQVLNCSVSRAVEVQLLVVKVMADQQMDVNDAMMQALKSASEKVQ